jgi:hypothetical protein
MEELARFVAICTAAVLGVWAVGHFVFNAW